MKNVDLVHGIDLVIVISPVDAKFFEYENNRIGRVI